MAEAIVPSKSSAFESDLYHRPYQLTHRQCLHVMAGEGPPSTTLLLTIRKVMDAGLRRHDEVGIADESPLRAASISHVAVNERQNGDRLQNPIVLHQLLV